MKPPAIMSTPSRLSGRLRHAISPAAMYGTLIHSSSAIWMPLTSSLASASARAAPAVANPAAAIAHTTGRLGGLRAFATAMGAA